MDQTPLSADVAAVARILAELATAPRIAVTPHATDAPPTPPAASGVAILAGVAVDFDPVLAAWLAETRIPRDAGAGWCQICGRRCTRDGRLTAPRRRS